MCWAITFHSAALFTVRVWAGSTFSILQVGNLKDSFERKAAYPGMGPRVPNDFSYRLRLQSIVFLGDILIQISLWLFVCLLRDLLGAGVRRTPDWTWCASPLRPPKQSRQQFHTTNGWIRKIMRNEWAGGNHGICNKSSGGVESGIQMQMLPHGILIQRFYIKHFYVTFHSPSLLTQPWHNPTLYIGSSSLFLFPEANLGGRTKTCNRHQAFLFVSGSSPIAETTTLFPSSVSSIHNSSSCWEEKNGRGYLLIPS